MSKEAVYELMKALESDAELKTKLEKDLETSDQPLNDFVATAARAGYAFTGDEFVAAMDDLDAGKQKAQLSDAELDGVVAGLSVSSTATNLFRRYRAGPTAGSIRPGTPVLEEEEEEILQ